MQYRHSFILLSWSELRAGDPSLVGVPLWRTGIWRWPPLGRLQQARHEGAWLRLCLLMSLPCFFKVFYVCLSDLLSFCLLKTNFLLAHRSILPKILKGTRVTFIPLVSLVLAVWSYLTQTGCCPLSPLFSGETQFHYLSNISWDIMRVNITPKPH